jgi:two-component system chemotaxis response regulator CheB
VPVVRHIDSNKDSSKPSDTLIVPQPPSRPARVPLDLPPKPSELAGIVAARAARASGEPVIVGIAASAGGPTALAIVLGSLSPDLPISLAIVQHLPRGFAPSFVSFLQSRCALTVRLAEHGLVPRAGTVVLAPDDHHLEVIDGKFTLTSGPPVEGHRPAGTVLLRSLASLGTSAIGVVLSGIGRDGADGLRAMRDRNALTLAQNATTSVVYGMPRAAVEEGAAQQVLPVGEIGEAIAAAVLSPWRRRAT